MKSPKVSKLLRIFALKSSPKFYDFFQYLDVTPISFSLRRIPFKIPKQQISLSSRIMQDNRRRKGVPAPGRGAALVKKKEIQPTFQAKVRKCMT